MANLSAGKLALTTAGGLLAYSGIKGTTFGASLQSFIKGKTPATGQVTGIGLADSSASAVTPGTVSPHSYTVSATANRSVGQLMAASYGWVGAEWVALDALWSRESEWSNTADNPTSHAYGIPQALPASKLPHAGQPPELGGSSSSVSQIAWGLAYIRTRYGSPSAAWAHEEANGWY